MIGSIKGKIILKTDKFIIIETIGVGYKINISPDTLSKLKKTNEEVLLWIHTHVREDILDLYGFLDRQELEFFEMLINISGIGPKGALSILGIASIETLKKAVGTGDTAYLTKISGIGRKTAEKIVIELRDKLEVSKSGTSLQGELDTLEALKSLGYSQNEAREALKKVSPGVDTNTKIREALKILSGK
ncbi:Holliday junction DNA helicase RuvA [Candidatus Nomurabacteria bacterium RIFCSPHIGHO2_02_FULL_35_13]|uniref:Holliday junction branch migration complex subunit RuvA n=2 Tax=Candidatus Nomuraibacteriota TaxID=1752729 RepID=A0A1F6VP36_9BACT|nr:MAG: Holliday junction ATP-dependent DNA helicase RuvA [Candidatus Nomurabacteria bacterium GW2011_GWA1_35_8]OGI71339.1 MAG: Holliday junction DNA helicase RuvA [Candidatus Nomurabacteria bacterium RIFCSPHIGHO2_02_FULL_35_13]